jgi:hypothetical protein
VSESPCGEPCLRQMVYFSEKYFIDRRESCTVGPFTSAWPIVQSILGSALVRRFGSLDPKVPSHYANGRNAVPYLCQQVKTSLAQTYELLRQNLLNCDHAQSSTCSLPLVGPRFGEGSLLVANRSHVALDTGQSCGELALPMCRGQISSVR